jgi:hypothetical protein
MGRGVWVPAFAGTTLRMYALALYATAGSQNAV